MLGRVMADATDPHFNPEHHGLLNESQGEAAMTSVNVRYMVNDVEAAIAFYTTHFGFTPSCGCPSTPAGRCRAR